MDNVSVWWEGGVLKQVYWMGGEWGLVKACWVGRMGAET